MDGEPVQRLRFLVVAPGQRHDLSGPGSSQAEQSVHHAVDVGQPGVEQKLDQLGPAEHRFFTPTRVTVDVLRQFRPSQPAGRLVQNFIRDGVLEQPMERPVDVADGLVGQAGTLEALNQVAHDSRLEAGGMESQRDLGSPGPG
ncbi:MAG: hypothetical protein AAGJ19_22410 [Myxococcota bacterium]